MDQGPARPEASISNSRGTDGVIHPYPSFGKSPQEVGQLGCGAHGQHAIEKALRLALMKPKHFGSATSHGMGFSPLIARFIVPRTTATIHAHVSAVHTSRRQRRHSDRSHSGCSVPASSARGFSPCRFSPTRLRAQSSLEQSPRLSGHSHRPTGQFQFASLALGTENSTVRPALRQCVMQLPPSWRTSVLRHSVLPNPSCSQSEWSSDVPRQWLSRTGRFCFSG